MHGLIHLPYCYGKLAGQVAARKTQYERVWQLSGASGGPMAVASKQQGPQLSGGLVISPADAACNSVKSPILPKAP